MMLKVSNLRVLSLLKSQGMWKVVAILLALVNLKSLPFVWHLRLFRGLFTHIRRGVRFNSTTGPRALFQPLIISSYSPLLECDYNLHKSNSTYFSDLDISRTHLITALCGRGIGRVRNEKDVRASGRFSVMLGGVSCTFRREIKPYQRYEAMFTGKGSAETNLKSDAPRLSHDASPPATNPAIFASAISKYVFKTGRLTIPPERILEAADLLPPKQSRHHTPPATPSPETAGGITSDSQTALLLPKLGAGSADQRIDASLLPSRGDEVWDWAKVEDERLRGLKIVELMAGLDSLQDEFIAEDRPALGRF